MDIIALIKDQSYDQAIDDAFAYWSRKLLERIKRQELEDAA